MLLLLLLIPFITADPFWMTADLLRVDWSEGCLITAGCSHSRFEILGDLLPLAEEISISWLISEHFVQQHKPHRTITVKQTVCHLMRLLHLTPAVVFCFRYMKAEEPQAVPEILESCYFEAKFRILKIYWCLMRLYLRQECKDSVVAMNLSKIWCELSREEKSCAVFYKDTSRSFVSHWAKGKPEDLKLKCQVVGTDPLYGFPRVCDHTASIRVFPDGIDEVLERRRRQAITTTTALPEEELGKRLIEIRGKCFNVTVAVEKHTERCPWCLDPLNVALIEQRQPEDPSSAFSTSIFSGPKSDDKILHASVLILAGISIMTTMSFACALVALLRQKKSHRQTTIKTRCQPYSPPSKASEEENRYDMPWEQTLPLTYCLSSSSKSTTTSPLDSTPSFGALSIVHPYSFRPGCTITQTQIYHHTSPNSFTTAGRDSGMGSV